MKNKKIEKDWIPEGLSMYMYKIDDNYPNHLRAEIIEDSTNNCLMACEYKNESLIKVKETLNRVMNNMFLDKD